MKKSNGEGSITFRMRGGRRYYTAQVTIGTDENGNPIRKSKSSFIKREVVDWKSEQLAKKQEGPLSKASEWTLESLINHWLFNIYKGTVKPNSFFRMESLFRIHVLPHRIAKVQLSNLTTIVVESFFSDLKNSSSESVYNDVYYKFKRIMEYAKNIHAINSNPTKTITPLKVKKNEKQVWSVDEQLAIIKCLEDNYLDNLIRLAFASGLRLGELLGLNWDDLKNGVLTVNKQWQRQKLINADGTKRYVDIIDDPKTQGSARFVPLPTNINDYFEQRRESGIMFKGSIGGYISRGDPANRLKEIQAKLGIPYRNFHMIRHAYATRLFEKGADPKSVQKLLGHKTIATTMKIYTHVMNSRKSEVSELLSDFF